MQGRKCRRGRSENNCLQDAEMLVLMRTESHPKFANRYFISDKYIILFLNEYKCKKTATATCGKKKNNNLFFFD